MPERPTLFYANPDGRLAKLLRDPACRVCEGPGATFHHVPKRSQGGINCYDAGAAVCGSGTTGCHGLIEAGDAEACAAYGMNMHSQEIAYVLWLYGESRGRYYLAEHYFREIPDEWPLWRGRSYFTRPKVVFD